MHPHIVKGFSKWSKEQKIEWLKSVYLADSTDPCVDLEKYWHCEQNVQGLIDGFSENTITNFHMPFGIAPNYLIDGEVYAVPMVIEESSVVAAASAAAKFWLDKGGFHTQITGTTKLGQVHFEWSGSKEWLNQHELSLNSYLIDMAKSHLSRMEARGGGIQKMTWLDLSHEMSDLHQLLVSFETCDSMGANFINTTLEIFASHINDFMKAHNQPEVTVLMSILSNYTPECLVKAWVSCDVESLGSFGGEMSAAVFADRFSKAVQIARIDPYRATTHNKGIYNGIDAVILATGNDFRAVEACGHAFASRDGRYRSLSTCSIVNGQFTFELEVPFAVGTVGGLTSLHPLANLSLQLLKNPSAKQLMSIVAAVGLAQNFAAIRSLVTTGIQKGHMKMHLQNLILQNGGNADQIPKATAYFSDKIITPQAVREYVLNN